MKRLFGTDGIRGPAGEPPLDPPTVRRVGAALASVLRHVPAPHGAASGGAAPAAAGLAPRVVIGRDTRESGPAIEEALAEGLLAGGARVDRAGVITTPAIACLVRLLGYDAGVVISASHNPYGDNGIKVFAAGGDKLPDAVEAGIERLVLDGAAAEPAAPGVATPPASVAGRAPGPTAPATLAARYLEWLREAAGRDLSLKGRRLVLDCAHGAASVLAPAAFRAAGAEVVPLHCAPDGRNINAGCGALHMEALAAEVVRARATLGLAFDGDADRCLVADASGRILTGDHILYLAACDLQAQGRLRGDGVVGTVMSNLWLERGLAERGIALRRAPVGDKYVLEEMRRGGYVLGGEQSGHVIFLEKAATGDGLLTGLLLLDLLGRTGIDLAAWAASIRPYPQLLVNVPVRERPPLLGHPAIGPAIRREEEHLGGRGRLLVRYSGTEPQARIMVEGETAALVEESVARLTSVIRKAIGRDPS
jgi:phosphoglucosamine mutase